MAGERVPHLLQREYVDSGTLATQRSPMPRVFVGGALAAIGADVAFDFAW